MVFKKAVATVPELDLNLQWLEFWQYLHSGWSSDFMSGTLNMQATVPGPALDLPWLEFRQYPPEPMNTQWL